VNSVVIHAHCYQPPREDPFTDLVPVERSAAPFHDWNARITDESYLPLANARDLVARNRVNLFEWISFNVGPTLASWFDREAPAVLDAMRHGDAKSVARLGQGNAIASAYNHVILPLASPHERAREIFWGLHDFRARFGRESRGFWCPETAMDDDTAQALAEAGVQFAIVAPYQIRHGGGDGQPRRWHGANGRSLYLAPYHGELSGSIGFGDLAQQGERLAAALATVSASLGIASIATDGETFGHHKRHGEMALATAIGTLRRTHQAAVTNFAAVIASRDDWADGELVSPSAWSCAHGVERWRSNCGCGATQETGRAQEWRGPLRAALRWLAEALDTADGDDPELTPQRRARYGMFTSCGWFFDRFEGHEPRLLLRMAAFAIAGRKDADRLEAGLVARLIHANSNDRTLGNGADLWYRDFHPLVAAHPK
jgi:alpha-amylase/alpha-mannosidase (GH57 family)